MTLGQNNQPEGDSSRLKVESAGDQVQKQAENLERHQANTDIASGELNKPVQEDNTEKKRTGKSKATGKLVDDQGRGLASAKDLLGDAAHMTLTADLTEDEIQQLGRQYEAQHPPAERPVLIASNETQSKPAEVTSDATNAREAKETPEQRRERYERLYQELLKNPIVGEKKELAPDVGWTPLPKDQDLLAQAPKDDPFTRLKNKFEHPGRNEPDAGVDYVSAKDAYQRFGLDKYGIDRDLIGGILRNEQYWLNKTDVVQDYLAEHRPFLKSIEDTWTVGPGQVQIRIMEEGLVEKYSDKLPEFKPAKQIMTVGGIDVGERPADIAMLAQNKKNAALIVGAYLADVVEKLEAGKPPCAFGASDAANATITNLWRTGKPEARQEALIRSFNPEEGKKHVQNVLSHLDYIKKKSRQH